MTLTNVEREYLKGYSPKNEHYTSVEEMFEVEKALCLGGLDIDALCEKRDEVVLYYRGLRKGVDSATDWKLFQGMLSVTAIIDNCKANVGGYDRI